MQKLEQIWAKAVYLRDEFEARKTDQPISEELKRKWDATPKTLRVNTQKGILSDLHHHDAWRRTRDQLISELSVGALVGIGRRIEQDRVAGLEEIPIVFWATAELDVSDNQATGKSCSYDRIKLSTHRLQAVGDADIATDPYLEGKKPVSDLRMEAVLACIQNGAVELRKDRYSKRDGTNNITVRVNSYLDWIRSTYSEATAELAGLSEKSFENTENEINKNKDLTLRIVPNAN